MQISLDKGIVCTPNTDCELNAYCDSDFAGMWHKNNTHLRESVLSRTGYIVQYCGCPIVWASKLQTEIALSSTEAEFMALSACMRVLLPLRSLLREITTKSFISNLKCDKTMISSHELKASKVYEDNAGCIVLATTESIRPRTRHIATKYHRFKDEVRRGECEVLKIDTKENIADIFTKPLTQVTFEYLRKLMMGW